MNSVFFIKKIQRFAKRLAESGIVFRSCFLELFNSKISINDFGGQHFVFLQYKRRSEDKQVGNFMLFQANIRVYIGRKTSDYQRKGKLFIY